MNTLFENYTLPQQKKAPAHHWQQVALDALEYIQAPPNKRGNLFKWAKLKEVKLEAALDYMKARGIKDFFYLASIMNK